MVYTNYHMGRTKHECVLQAWRNKQADIVSLYLDIDPREPSPAVENFAEALRLFPPFRDDDAATLGVPEVKCPDCDAVFSSAYVNCRRPSFGVLGVILTRYRTELNQHYLSRYCSGSAIAVYVMTRDRYFEPSIHVGHCQN